MSDGADSVQSYTTGMLRFAPLVLLAGLLTACSAPEPPTLEPKRAEVKQVALSGLEVELTIEADNPNSIPLVARKVKARVKLDDRVDLGEVSVSTKLKIPPKESVSLVAPLSLSWTDLGSIATLAASKTDIPFTVTGTAEIGTDDVSFDVPFQTKGSLTRDQLTKLGTGALPIPIPTTLPKLF
jgi:LEA14-like dessication related protein